METSKRLVFLRNILILASLIGLVLLSWLLGHILRYSVPSLWHPPLQETDPQIKMGIELEFDGIRREIVLPGFQAVSVPAQVQPGDVWGIPPVKCLGTIYYTSLPAKCRTADRRLVEVGGFEFNVILIPQGK